MEELYWKYMKMVGYAIDNKYLSGADEALMTIRMLRCAELYADGEVQWAALKIKEHYLQDVLWEMQRDCDGEPRDFGEIPF